MVFSVFQHTDIYMYGKEGNIDSESHMIIKYLVFKTHVTNTTHFFNAIFFRNY